MATKCILQKITTHCPFRIFYYLLKGVCFKNNLCTLFVCDIQIPMLPLTEDKEIGSGPGQDQGVNGLNNL